MAAPALPLSLKLHLHPVIGHASQENVGLFLQPGHHRLNQHGLDPLTAKCGNQFLVDPFVFFQGRQTGRVPADLPSEPLHSLQLPVKIAETGSSPEPLEGGLTPQLLAQSLEGRKAPIKALLLEQPIVAGMGNLYADESLFLAGINPTRSAAGLSGEEIDRLQQSIVNALTASIEKYENARDESWPDPPRALTGWSHPRTEGAPCPRCNGPFTGTRVRARGTYYCPSCQP
ncbi:MAG TPA: hypothetical protein EYO17_09060 [Dehalococcoidia bacterium]|nr:hypothetical protein [Dehalococcoidia bacterium]